MSRSLTIPRRIAENSSGDNPVAATRSISRPCSRNAGPAAVRLRYRNASAQCDLLLGQALQVRLDDALLEALSEWLQPENVEIVY